MALVGFYEILINGLPGAISGVFTLAHASIQILRNVLEPTAKPGYALTRKVRKPSAAQFAAFALLTRNGVRQKQRHSGHIFWLRIRFKILIRQNGVETHTTETLSPYSFPRLLLAEPLNSNT